MMPRFIFAPCRLLALATLSASLALSAARDAPAQETADQQKSAGQQTEADVHARLNEMFREYRRHDQAGRVEQATQVERTALRYAEANLPEFHRTTALIRNNLGVSLNALKQYDEAETLLTRALAEYERIYGPDHLQTAIPLENLAITYGGTKRQTDALRLYDRCLRILIEELGPEDPRVAKIYDGRSMPLMQEDRFDEAHQSVDKALAIYADAYGTEHPSYFAAQRSRGMIWGAQGIHLTNRMQLDSARTFLHRALEHFQRLHRTPDNPDAHNYLKYLGVADHHQGRYRTARRYYERALELYDRHLGPNHPSSAQATKNLAFLYIQQNQFSEAERLFQRNLKICLDTYGPDDTHVADALQARCELFRYIDRIPQAIEDYDRALDIYRKHYGDVHVEIGRIYHNVAVVYRDLEDWDRVAENAERALQLYRQVHPPGHPDIAFPLTLLAEMEFQAARYPQARAYLDEAIQLRESSGMEQLELAKCYAIRARCHWHEGDSSRAIENLRSGIEYLQRQRAQFAGSDQDRARTFAHFTVFYDRMVDWQLELGQPENVAAALVYAEQGRARSLLDQIRIAGVDLLAGLSESEQTSLRDREENAEARIVELEARLAELDAESADDENRKSRLDQLRAELTTARAELVDAFAAIRNASPAYKNLTLATSKDATLDDPGRIAESIQSELAADDRLVLQYFLGVDNSYVFVIPPVGQPIRAHRLTVDADQAAQLGIEPGPLTDTDVIAALYGDHAVVPALADPDADVDAPADLATLWQVLVPPDDRRALLDGDYRVLVVIPDRVLSHLPFETLVVNAAGEAEPPTYLLDAGPPIVYAPSASVLMHLARDDRRSNVADRRPVLTVGDPSYTQTAQAPTPTDEFTSTARLANRELAARLAPLPYSGIESQWVAEVFGDQGIDVGTLLGDRATEDLVRRSAPGRRLLHLACHGVADEDFGNTFGALILSQTGPAAGPKNDGFLSLPEIYNLDLRGCELAILSACQTNYGPGHVGEGVWSLSRGFLVAGARRVVASNWLVDDEAAASLVSVLASAIARAESSGDPVDYAAALQLAKRWVRKQPKWSHPYYWAGLVQLGPQ